jgi:nicotinamide phosphoribosyltransferase
MFFGGSISKKRIQGISASNRSYLCSITVTDMEICERLKLKGFTSTNVVLGIGSFTYQYNTRYFGLAK